MIAIKTGTTRWRQTEALAADEVELSGEFLYEANGFTPAMVWDVELNNVRAMTQAEKDTRDAPKVQAESDKGDFNTQYAAAINRLDAIIAQGASRNNAQAQAALTDLATIVKRHLKVTKADG